MLEDHIILEPYVFSDETHIRIAFNTPTMAQVSPIAPPTALAAGAAAAPLAIQQAPTTYREKFAGMGDLYGGDYLPLLHAHHPEVVLTAALVAEMVLTLSTHNGLPSVYAYQMHDTHQIRTLHRISQPSNLPGLATQWDGITFAFAGDVPPPGLINLVQLPVNPFHLTTAIYAPSPPC